MGVERELKFIADEGRDVPDLRPAIEGLRYGTMETATLSATYYDTEDLRLARAGVTLRSRRGEPGPVWTLKLPLGDDKGELSRREIVFGGPASKLPVEASDAVLAYRRGAALQKVSELRTQRVSTPLLLNDQLVAVLCDDTVEAERGKEPVTFREIEVELHAVGIEANAVLKAVRNRFERSDWKIEGQSVPKVVRVLGAQAVAPADVVVPTLSRRARVSGAVQVAISRSVLEIVTFDAGTRLGIEPEDLHVYRVATRRLRSDLRTFRSLLDRSWAQTLRGELRWIGAEVGVIRDLDVLRVRLGERIAKVADPEAADALELLAMVDKQRDAARVEMLGAMRSDRYIGLLENLIDAARAPKWRDGTDVTDRDAARVFPSLVHKPWKNLRAAADDLTDDSSDEDLHDVRIVAKRCRYAVDAASLVCGRDARRFATAIKAVQTVLGDHQDTVVTEAWLRRAAGERPSVGLLAGLLIANEIEERSVLRSRAAEVWSQAERPRLRAWMDQ